MKTRILGVALALASLVTASYAGPATSFSATTSSSDLTVVGNILSGLPTEYSVDGPRLGTAPTGGPIFDPQGPVAIAAVSTLTDGQALIADGSYGLGNGNSANQFSVWDGDALTYSLGGSYNLTQFQIYSSYTDTARDDLTNVAISFSADNGESFNPVLGSINSSNLGSGHVLVITTVNAGGSVIAAGATNVRFTFTGVENGAIPVSELVAQGTSAIPEPSTYAAIFGVLALGAAAFRRRQTRA